MNSMRDTLIAVGVMVVLIAGFGLWVAYSKGEISFTRKAPIENLEFPRSVREESSTNTTATSMSTENPTVTLATSKGNIVIELYADLMPITAQNFEKLAREGFYDGTKFHRVIDGFMIQGGDPNTKGDNVATYGTGGPGYAIPDEHISDPKLSNVRGTIAMANSGPNSGGSQFFINLVDNTGLDFDKQPLTSKHPVFGRVIEGMDIVDAIAKVPTNERDMPLEPVIISDATVHEAGAQQ